MTARIDGRVDADDGIAPLARVAVFIHQRRASPKPDHHRSFARSTGTLNGKTGSDSGSQNRKARSSQFLPSRARTGEVNNGNCAKKERRFPEPGLVAFAKDSPSLISIHRRTCFSIHTSEVDGLLRGTVRRVRHRGVNLQVPDIASVFLQNL